MGFELVYLYDFYCVLIISYFKSCFILSFIIQQFKERFLENILDFYLINFVKFYYIFSDVINMVLNLFKLQKRFEDI